MTGTLDLDSLFRSNLPGPVARFTGLPRYNFISGHNDPDRVPVAELMAAAETGLKREGKRFALYNLGYGPAGYPPLRAMVADKLNATRGMAITADEVIITSGSTQGLDMANNLFLAPGDTVLVEEFTYSGAIGRIRNRGVTAIALPLDTGGIDMAALETILSDLAARGVRPKYIYTIPTVQNPTGSIMSLERRQRLLALARQFHTLVLEDECYADLPFGEYAAPPALYAMAPGQVVHVGSFSKTLAPALRLGYVVGPWDVLGRMLAIKGDSGTGALEQVMVADFAAGHFAAHVETLRTALRQKRDAMLEALAREFGTAIEISVPEGGIFIWIKFDDHVDTSALLAPAKAAGVVFNAGAEWAIDPARGRPFLRLCFALPSTADIDEGIAVLARVFHDEIGIPARGDNRNRPPAPGAAS